MYDYELKIYDPFHPQQITTESWVRLSAFNQAKYRRKVSGRIPERDKEGTVPCGIQEPQPFKTGVTDTDAGDMQHSHD